MLRESINRTLNIVQPDTTIKFYDNSPSYYIVVRQVYDHDTETKYSLPRWNSYDTWYSIQEL